MSVRGGPVDSNFGVTIRPSQHSPSISAKADRPLWHLRAANTPSLTEWVVAVLVAVIQQGAFVSVPLLLTGGSLDATIVTQTPNPFNTIAVSASGAAILFFGFSSWRSMYGVVRGNTAQLILTLFVVASMIWSIHSGLTLRRGSNYVLTMFFAIYLASRFTLDQAMRILSASIALSGFGSILFVAAFPNYGIAHEVNTVAAWRGVFAQKNPFGLTMSVGVFVECYLLASQLRRWNLFLLAVFLALIYYAHDATAFMCSILYIFGAYNYTLFARSRPLAFLSIIALGLTGIAAVVALWISPSLDLSFLNRDTTLTGRTNLWPMVLDLIRHRPVLGWGYAATWQQTDAGPAMIAKVLNWAPAHSHNEWLEVTLQLGLTGAALLLAVILVTISRGLQCFGINRTKLGFFVLLFVFGTAIHGVTEVVLVQSQSIAWVLFSLLGFKAGQAIERAQSGYANARPRVQLAS